jgi:hypothetical protein
MPASKKAGRQRRAGMKVIRDLTVSELDKLFRDATTTAAREALESNLTITGTDDQSRIVEVDKSVLSSGVEDAAGTAADDTRRSRTLA